MQSKDDAFRRLSESPFRSRFRLSEKDRQYIEEKGMDEIQRHAEEFIEKRLAPCSIPNDGSQTPMKGHPVFIAQHATACCCRGCLEKWYGVPKNTPLTPDQQARIVGLLMEWIRRDLNKPLPEKRIRKKKEPELF